MTAPRSAPCSIRSRARWPRSPATVDTTRTASTPASPSAIPKRRSSCRRARPPCRARRPRPRPRSATAICSCIAEHGRMAWQKASGYNNRARAEADNRPVQTGDRRRAALAHGRASGDRGGRRRRCPQPHGGAGTPELRPHRLTSDGVGATASALLIHATYPRAAVLNDTLEDAIRRRYPGFRPANGAKVTKAAA